MVNEKTIWMVRAGKGGYLFKDFENKKVVAIGWNETGDLSNMSTHKEITQIVKKTYPHYTQGQIYVSAGQISRFRFNFKKGDNIITYNSKERVYLVGKVISDYEYNTKLINYFHIRRVKWLGKVSRDKLSTSTRNELGALCTIFKLKEDTKEEIIKFLKGEEVVVEQKVKKIKEDDFYKPFTNWLVKELKECTKAIPLGGKRFKDKWGTPDVIGKREPRRSDIVKTPTEIISAEMKIDTKDLISAFGQACSYKLFSHKSYIVIPKNSSPDDISKLDALCLIFGIGLVLFDNNKPNDPQFEIKVRPTKHEPDMFYVNKYMKEIERDLW